MNDEFNHKPSVAIIDSGGANINSVVFAFQRLGIEPLFTDDWEVIRGSSHVVLPGVGSASAAMDQLQRAGLVDRIPQLTQPVIGICLGMQLLFESSEEGDVDCLGIIPARISALPVAPGITIPHMGWNRNALVTAHPLLADVDDGFYGYFVHSYAAPIGSWTLAQSHHGSEFSSMVCHNNFVGIQFHPERSAAVGQQLLSNFLRLQSEVPA